MAAAQQLLFPDPQPLVERLGRDFFRQLPECAGVYLMRDATDAVLYVGKAKNLRKRLGSYRVANPDRMPRRHLRLLRAVVRIELQFCEDERAALNRESELLRTLRPKFNRAGTWPGRRRFLAYARRGETLALKVVESPELGWQMLPPSSGGAAFLRVVLVRLLWFAVHPGLGITAMPAGWVHGRLEPETAIHCGEKTEAAAAQLEQLFSGQSQAFCDWINAQVPTDVHPFEKSLVDEDLEFIAEVFPNAVESSPQTSWPDQPSLAASDGTADEQMRVTSDRPSGNELDALRKG